MTTYSSRLRLALQEVGENDNTWGIVLNNGALQLADDAIGGAVSIIANSSPRTLTTVNGASDEARNMILLVTGAPETGEQLIRLGDFFKHGLAILVLSLLVLWGWVILDYWQFIGF